MADSSAALSLTPWAGRRHSEQRYICQDTPDVVIGVGSSIVDEDSDIGNESDVSCPGSSSSSRRSSIDDGAIVAARRGSLDAAFLAIWQQKQDAGSAASGIRRNTYDALAAQKWRKKRASILLQEMRIRRNSSTPVHISDILNNTEESDTMQSPHSPEPRRNPTVSLRLQPGERPMSPQLRCDSPLSPQSPRSPQSPVSPQASCTLSTPGHSPLAFLYRAEESGEKDAASSSTSISRNLSAVSACSIPSSSSEISLFSEISSLSACSSDALVTGATASTAGLPSVSVDGQSASTTVLLGLQMQGTNAQQYDQNSTDTSDSGELATPPPRPQPPQKSNASLQSQGHISLTIEFSRTADKETAQYVPNQVAYPSEVL